MRLCRARSRRPRPLPVGHRRLRARARRLGIALADAARTEAVIAEALRELGYWVTRCLNTERQLDELYALLMARRPETNWRAVVREE